ncbi:MAG: nucleotidyl transferase AbiEii/AbiGii toxin family protein [Candidatus Omnitrophica bacterium]|nr:nucleotidyl transferase AbiEii/AbiGii toxin family protein [Candidatus Omnitrophota bacterium]
MNPKIRKAQNQILKVFSKKANDFGLAGGTALELYYLHHRFSADLDFFSHKYEVSEINNLVSAFGKDIDKRIHLESEFVAGGKAKVRFYTIPVKGSSRPLKIDFVEDVIFQDPAIRKIEGVRVYSVENIYLQKIIAISGIRPEIDEIGRQIIEGRKEGRDVFDVYMLSKNIQPLHIFLRNVSSQLQRGMIHWYRTFSRQDLKLALIDMDIYDKKFNSREMIIYLENEIKEFMREVIE